MKQPIFLYIIVCFTLLTSCKQILNDEAKVISIEEMQTLLEIDSVQLVDVRTPKEYNEGYIENAKNINLLSPTFLNEFEALDKEKPILLYCRSGKRSTKCAAKLIEAGFVKIYNLEGGITKWKREGLEIKVKL